VLGLNIKGDGRAARNLSWLTPHLPAIGAGGLVPFDHVCSAASQMLEPRVFTLWTRSRENTRERKQSSLTQPILFSCQG
jgi:hypothetical protein